MDSEFTKPEAFRNALNIQIEADKEGEQCILKRLYIDINGQVAFEASPVGYREERIAWLLLMTTPYIWAATDALEKAGLTPECIWKRFIHPSKKKLIDELIAYYTDKETVKVPIDKALAIHVIANQIPDEEAEKLRQYMHSDSVVETIVEIMLESVPILEKKMEAYLPDADDVKSWPVALSVFATIERFVVINFADSLPVKLAKNILDGLSMLQLDRILEKKEEIMNKGGLDA